MYRDFKSLLCTEQKDRVYYSKSCIIMKRSLIFTICGRGKVGRVISQVCAVCSFFTTKATSPRISIFLQRMMNAMDSIIRGTYTFP